MMNKGMIFGGKRTGKTTFRLDICSVAGLRLWVRGRSRLCRTNVGVGGTVFINSRRKRL